MMDKNHDSLKCKKYFWKKLTSIYDENSQLSGYTGNVPQINKGNT